MIYIAWALAEIVNITVFGLLAYHFDHWWIVLFAVLTSSSVKARGRK